MNVERTHETPGDVEERGSEAFDLDIFTPRHNGFDEDELSTKLHKQIYKLYEMLIAGRKHNQNVAEDGRKKFSQDAVGRRMVGAPSQAYVSQLEHGLVNLVDTLTSYALAAGLDVSYNVSSAVDGTSLAHDVDNLGDENEETDVSTWSTAYDFYDFKSTAEENSPAYDFEDILCSI